MSENQEFAIVSSVNYTYSHPMDDNHKFPIGEKVHVTIELQDSESVDDVDTPISDTVTDMMRSTAREISGGYEKAENEIFDIIRNAYPRNGHAFIKMDVTNIGTEKIVNPILSSVTECIPEDTQEE